MDRDVYIVDRNCEPRGLSRLGPAQWARALGDDLVELWRDRHIVAFQVSADLKARYQHSVLGIVWSLLNPILMLLVLAMVFSQILQRRTLDMTFYLFAGMVPWQFFMQTLQQGSCCLIRKARLMEKVRINKLVFSVAGLVENFIVFTLVLVALQLLLMAALGMPVHVQMVLLPACMVILAGFTFGLTLFLMVVIIYFRDMEHITSVVLRGWYFLTPIIYPMDMINSPTVRRVLELNPMTHMIKLFRCCLYTGQWPTAGQWLVPAAIAAGALVVGYAAYRLRCDDLLYRL